MPDFFVKKFREFLIKCFTEEGFSAGICNTRIPAAAVNADPVVGVKDRLILASKCISVPGFIGLGFQSGDDFLCCGFICL